MRLSDLRRLSVKNNLRIRFTLSNGMDCILNEHGIAQVPELRAVPAFDLERELGEAQEFMVEPAGATEKEKIKNKPRRYTRDEMTTLVTAGAAGPAAHDDHDD
jgi:hypothetical protein